MITLKDLQKEIKLVHKFMKEYPNLRQYHQGQLAILKNLIELVI